MEEGKLGLEISQLAETLRRLNRDSHRQLTIEDAAYMIAGVLDSLAIRVNHWERELSRSGKVV